MMYTVTPLLNVSEDNFLGYDANDDVASAPDLTLRVEASSWNAAAEEAFTVGNRMHVDADGRSWPSDVRSLSVGDVVRVTADGANAITRYAACESVGFAEVAEPPHVVDLAGTKATSRR